MTGSVMMKALRFYKYYNFHAGSRTYLIYTRSPSIFYSVHEYMIPLMCDCSHRSEEKSRQPAKSGSSSPFCHLKRRYGQKKIPETSKIMASGTFLIRLCNGVGGIRTRVLNVFTDPSTCLSCFHTFRVILTGELYAED